MRYSAQVAALAGTIALASGVAAGEPKSGWVIDAKAFETRINNPPKGDELKQVLERGLHNPSDAWRREVSPDESFSTEWSGKPTVSEEASPVGPALQMSFNDRGVHYRVVRLLAAKGPERDSAIAQLNAGCSSGEVECIRVAHRPVDSESGILSDEIYFSNDVAWRQLIRADDHRLYLLQADTVGGAEGLLANGTIGGRFFNSFKLLKN